jgi:hypothetical protein
MRYACLMMAIIILFMASAEAQDSLKVKVVGDMTVRAVPAMTVATVKVKAADFVPVHGWAKGEAGIQQAYEVMLTNGYEKLARWIKEGGHPTGPSFVIFHEDPATARPNDLTCTLGYPVAESAKGLHRAKIERLSPGVAATVRYQGGLGNSLALRDSLQSWIWANGYAPAGSLMTVCLRGSRAAKGSSDMEEIRWPVRKMVVSETGLAQERAAK